ncbi:MAG TPA: hypothetical protein VMW50_01025 [Dehalococcoidia bacterium]|nr:hypothetical protein [Dehalococcoidia bacterium]
MATRKKAPTKKRATKKTATRGGRRGKSASVVSVDFTDVEAGGGMPTPDGYYVATCMSAEMEASQAGNDMIVVRWKTNIGSTVFDRFVLVPQALWVLRTALNCMGYDTPDGPFEFDPEDLVGNKIGLEIVNEEYEEKDQPRVTGYLTEEVAEKYVEEGGGSVEEEEEYEEEEEAPKKRTSRSKKKQEEEEEYEEDDDGEEEEEEEAPKKKAAKKKAPAKKASRKSSALRPGARVIFEDEDGNDVEGVIEGLEDDVAVVVDDEDGEWEIPVSELKKA